jgi:membrane protein DedA with SNARE-associated domain
LYLLGRRGGEAVLRRRFRQSRIESGLALFRRYGPLVIIVPALLPPPMPFKVFVLLAGAAGIRPGLFIGLVSIGRGLRYGGWAFLAYLYGEPAVAFVEDHLAAVAVTLAAIALLGATVTVLWRRRRAA